MFLSFLFDESLAAAAVRRVQAFSTPSAAIPSSFGRVLLQHEPFNRRALKCGKRVNVTTCEPSSSIVRNLIGQSIVYLTKEFMSLFIAGWIGTIPAHLWI